MRIFASLLLVSLLIFVGCATTDPIRPVPIAGGKVVGIPFGPHGPLPGRANGYEVVYAASVPGPVSTQLVYKFAFKAPPGVKLKRVVVDDISDEQNGTLIDDLQPWLDDNYWRGETKAIENKDPLLAWIYTVTPSMRVYRFSVTDSNDKVAIMYQITGYLPAVKGAIRASWGEKY